MTRPFPELEAMISGELQPSLIAMIVCVIKLSRKELQLLHVDLGAHPRADYVCRSEPACLLENATHQGLPFIKQSKEIYLSDVDSSHVLVVCSNKCRVALHETCWAARKSSQKKEEKKMGRRKGENVICSTPNCGGFIIKEEHN